MAGAGSYFYLFLAFFLLHSSFSNEKEIGSEYPRGNVWTSPSESLRPIQGWHVLREICVFIYIYQHLMHESICVSSDMFEKIGENPSDVVVLLYLRYLIRICNFGGNLLQQHKAGTSLLRDHRGGILQPTPSLAKPRALS